MSTYRVQMMARVRKLSMEIEGLVIEAALLEDRAVAHGGVVFSGLKLIKYQLENKRKQMQELKTRITAPKMRQDLWASQLKNKRYAYNGAVEELRLREKELVEMTMGFLQNTSKENRKLQKQYSLKVEQQKRKVERLKYFLDEHLSKNVKIENEEVFELTDKKIPSGVEVLDEQKQEPSPVECEIITAAEKYKSNPQANFDLEPLDFSSLKTTNTLPLAALNGASLAMFDTESSTKEPPI